MLELYVNISILVSNLTSKLYGIDKNSMLSILPSSVKTSTIYSDSTSGPHNCVVSVIHDDSFLYLKYKIQNKFLSLPFFLNTNRNIPL